MKKYYVIKASSWKTALVEFDMDDPEYSEMSEEQLTEAAYEAVGGEYDYNEAEVEETFNEGDQDTYDSKINIWKRHADIKIWS